MTRGLGGLGLLAVALAGCSSLTDINDDSLEAARAKWQANQPAAYSFALERACVCNGPTVPIVIEVRNQVVVSRTYQDSGNPLEAEFASSFPRVEGLFDIIEKASRDKVFSWTAEFDNTFGFPQTIEINPSPATADDDIMYFVTDFTPIT